jgi:hypothetical protein
MTSNLSRNEIFRLDVNLEIQVEHVNAVTTPCLRYAMRACGTCMYAMRACNAMRTCMYAMRACNAMRACMWYAMRTCRTCITGGSRCKCVCRLNLFFLVDRHRLHFRDGCGQLGKDIAACKRVIEKVLSRKDFGVDTLHPPAHAHARTHAGMLVRARPAYLPACLSVYTQVSSETETPTPCLSVCRCTCAHIRRFHQKPKHRQAGGL